MNNLKETIKQSLNEYFNSINKIGEVQNKILMDIIEFNSKTLYGEKYNFENIKCRDDFVKQIPINTYNDLKPFIQENKYKENIILKGSINYWAKTSGTSGTHKYIPHTKKSLELWNKGVLRDIYGFMMHEQNINLLKDNYTICIVGPALVEKINSVPVGYISGIIPSINDIIKNHNLTNDSVNTINNYQEKMQAIFELSLDNPVSFFGGITTFTINFINYVYKNGYEMAKNNPKYLKKITECLNKDKTINIRKLWPQLKFCLSTGMDINLCRDNLLKFLPDLWISNLYAGTEGAYGFAIESGVDELYLNYDLYYYEFRSITNGKVYTLTEVEKNSTYEMIITCYNGLYRYTNGDLIEFVSLNPPVIRVLGRSNMMINIAGEKFNDSEINSCVISTVKQLNLIINGYCFFGWINDDGFVHHCIVIEVNKGQYNIEDISMVFFENLKKNKAFYRRGAGEVFKIPHVIVLKKGTFSELQKNISNKKGIIGHSKIKHIYNYDEITKLIRREYIYKHNIPLNIINDFITPSTKVN